MYSIDLKAGVINKGNTTRIKNVMQKARRGEGIKVAFLGGSITQGSLSSAPDTCYAALVYKWWCRKFPESDIEYINAGIGGTTSLFGVSRVRQHVLCHKPDFILTEFAVNDENNDLFMETYEGLVRTILSDKSSPALMLMNNIKYDDRTSAEEIHLKVAAHYDVPMVSMKSTIMPEIIRGSFDISDISPDGLHPNDEGHMLVASVITDYLDTIYDSIMNEPLNEESGSGNEMGSVLPDPLTANAYEDSLRIKAYNMKAADHEVFMNGFVTDDHPKKEFLDIFSSGFTASKTGGSITFKAVCSGMAVQYKKTVNRPAPVAKAVLDGDEDNAVILDANFDEDWGDCLYIEVIGRHMELKEHEISIRLIETHEDDKVPFYLTSLIVSR